MSGARYKLARDVALKVIPDAFAHDAERLAGSSAKRGPSRRSIIRTSPMFCGFEQSGGVNVLVMEFVDGEDLAERIRRGAIPLDDAIPIARQIARRSRSRSRSRYRPSRSQAREHQGQEEDGTVKVLDFRLAKASDPASAISHPSSRSVSIRRRLPRRQ